MGKLIVISAPSGAGKTSIAHYLLENITDLSFSISSCSRDARDEEKDGQDYYFITIQEFQNKIKEDAFLEWEEVYENQYYGTLKSEIDRIFREQKSVIFDVDVMGGINIKNQYPKECLSIFIMPPSLDCLRERLIKRGSESEENILLRLRKSKQEISKHTFFDLVIVNDNLDSACKEVFDAVIEFIKK